MYDVDTKNAHLSLLSWYCNENGVDCAGLDSYVTHKDEYITDYMEQYHMSRDDVKTHLLAIINGRKVKLDSECFEWYRKFYGGMQGIIKKIAEMHPDLYKLAKSLRKTGALTII